MAWVIRTLLKAVLLSLIILFAILLYTESPLSLGGQFTIANDAKVPLTEVLLTGPKFEQAIGTIAPGESMAVRVNGELGPELQLKFRTPKGFTALGGLFPVERRWGVRVTVRINENLEAVPQISTPTSFLLNLKKHFNDLFSRQEVELK